MSVLVGSVVGVEGVNVHPAPPHVEFRDAIHLPRLDEMSFDIGRWHVESLQEVVLEAEEGSQHVLEPRHAGVVLHVLGDVGMVRAHDGYVLGSSIVDEVQGRDVRGGDVDDGGLEIGDLGLDGP